MKKILLSTVFLICSVLAVQAAEMYLPTVAYRGGDFGGYGQKFEYAYDSYGHITSEKAYNGYRDLDEWELWHTTTRAYQQLSNGEFILISEITADDYAVSEMTAAYDSKGMQLLYKKVTTYSNNSSVIEHWQEAVVDVNGIRTGLKVWDGSALVLSPEFTFDSKGRVTKQVHDEIDDNGDFTRTYTWGDGEKDLLAMKMGNAAVGDDFISYTNIEPVKNLEYFNPYHLNIFENSNDFGGSSKVSSSNNYLYFSWDLDNYAYTHGIFFNADGKVLGYPGKVQCTITDNVWTRITTADGMEGEFEKDVLTKLPNGGWESAGSYEFGNFQNKERREYDEYGLLTRTYNGYDEVGYGSGEYEQRYERVYDALGRLTKTTVTYYSNGELTGTTVETYTEWTNTSPTGINTPAAEPLTVYPTITDGIVHIGNPDGETVTVYNVSGAKALEARTQSIDLSAYPKGVYFLTAGNRIAKVIRK
ncbi:MAG: T9SS type A sorting domain-containing protein [Prevotellaceae bacterium]|jgi:hypothetical protein|nr:T9SS type A sorting domain-containing protein [Prevotellaceae bacterium]